MAEGTNSDNLAAMFQISDPVSADIASLQWPHVSVSDDEHHNRVGRSIQ